MPGNGQGAGSGASPGGFSTPTFGVVRMSIVAGDDAGWIWLNGRAKSSLTSSQQTAATAAGIGANLPDMRGAFPIGSGGAKAVLTTGGSTTITRGQLPNIGLTVTGSTNSAGLHGHNLNLGNQGGGEGTAINNDSAGSGAYRSNFGGGSIFFDLQGVHSHGVSGNTESINGNVTQQAHEPPFCAVNFQVYLGL